jgi:two-component system cell cycle sensor histidine kinase/response regulator CckA
MDVNKMKADRIDDMIEAIVRVARGDYSAQVKLSGEYDEIDSLAVGINMMIDDLKTGTVRHEYVENRLAGILDAVRRLARSDYSVVCELSEENDDFDALAMGINMMIDDIRQSQEALRESKENLSAILNSIGDAVIAADVKGNVVFLNPVAESLTGWTQLEAAGKPVEEVFHIVNEETGEEVESPVKKVLREGSVVGLANHTVLLARDDSKIPIDDSGAPIKDGKGNITGVVLVFRDISERKALQEQLVRQEKLAVLGELAGGVGHELRNPLGAIKNSAYFLNMVLERPDPEIKETLGILEKEVANCERIIAGLLDFARARAPLRRKVKIADVLQEVLSAIDVPGNITMKNRVAKSLPIILADPDQLTQVFGNIILNAVQAMPAGGELLIKSETSEPEWIAVSVTDTGGGIPPENLRKIFEPLFTGKAKGIGLGMAITRTFVEGHGGSIEVRSRVGKGSTFTVRLPLGEKKEVHMEKKGKPKR